MGFSREWDSVYSSGQHVSIWPWSELVSYVMRYARPRQPGYRVLEVGCGAGANIPFFLHLKADYYGIDGSPTIIAQLKERYPAIASQLAVADFTSDLHFKGSFDLIVDRSSLTCNSTAAIKDSIVLIRDSLKSGGKYIGIDWHSTASSQFPLGAPVDDDYTRTGYTSGQFGNIGKCHFCDKEHLLSLFSSFNVELLEHKIIHREIPRDGGQTAWWNIVAAKD